MLFNTVLSWLNFGIPSFGLPWWLSGKESAGQFQSLGWEGALEKEMATHSSTISWRIPWTEEPGELQTWEVSMIKSMTDLKKWVLWASLSSHKFFVTSIYYESLILVYILPIYGMYSALW